jgi:hypothetical protein
MLEEGVCDHRFCKGRIYRSSIAGELGTHVYKTLLSKVFPQVPHNAARFNPPQEADGQRIALEI